MSVGESGSGRGRTSGLLTTFRVRLSACCGTGLPSSKVMNAVGGASSSTRIQHRIKEVQHLRAEDRVMAANEDQHLAGRDDPLLARRCRAFAEASAEALRPVSSEAARCDPRWR